MALTIELTRTIPLYPYGVFVQWDVRGVTAPGTYTFVLYRSGSSAGPWTTLATVVNDYNYHDTWPLNDETDINQLALSREIYYRVTVTGPAGTAETVSAVEPRLDGRHRLLKRKILRDQTVALRKLNGLPVAVLKRRRWGPHCHKCYDIYTHTVMRSGCTTCYGTAHEHGYYAPIVTLARPTTPVVNTHLTAQGESDQAMSMITLLDIPHIEKDDLLIFLRDNKRFIVKRPIPGKLEHVTIFQHLEAAELNRAAIEYRLLVDPTRIPPLF